MKETWSAVITAFNSGSTLGNALDSIIGLPPEEKPLDIIVVDNASGDDSGRIASSRPGVTLVENPVNLGLSRANNMGAAMSRGSSLFFLNPDVEIAPGAITALRGFQRAHPEAALLGPLMTDDQGVPQSTARTWPSLASVAARRTGFGGTGAGAGIARRHLYRFHTGAPERAHWLVGAALWLTPGGRKTVGLMNEGYFLYFEDVEWCLRAWRRGMEVWIVPDAVITHVCRRQSADVTQKAARLHFRSMIRFYSANPFAMFGKGPGIP
jgi:hypothetical protein